AVDRNRARVGTFQAGNRSNRRGFAAPAWAKKHTHPTIVNREREVADRFDGAEALADVTQGDVSHERRSAVLPFGWPIRSAHQTVTRGPNGTRVRPSRRRRPARLKAAVP